jgi:hypothetical protein
MKTISKSALEIISVGSVGASVGFTGTVEGARIETPFVIDSGAMIECLLLLESGDDASLANVKMTSDLRGASDEERASNSTGKRLEDAIFDCTKDGSASARLAITCIDSLNLAYSKLSSSGKVLEEDCGLEPDFGLTLPVAASGTLDLANLVDSEEREAVMKW